MPGCLRKSPSSMSHRRQSFFFILSVPLLLSKGPCHARKAPEISSCRSAVALTAPLLQALRCRCRRVNSLFKDRGSVLEGGVKVCKRPLVNEVLGLLLTEFFPDPTHKGATPIQRGLQSSLLVCIY